MPAITHAKPTHLFTASTCAAKTSPKRAIFYALALGTRSAPLMGTVASGMRPLLPRS